MQQKKAIVAISGVAATLVTATAGAGTSWTPSQRVTIYGGCGTQPGTHAITPSASIYKWNDLRYEVTAVAPSSPCSADIRIYRDNGKSIALVGSVTGTPGKGAWLQKYVNVSSAASPAPPVFACFRLRGSLGTSPWTVWNHNTNATARNC